MRISDWSSDVCSSDLQAVADGKRWVTGEIFGLPIPADAEALRSSGCAFLTTVFRAPGALADDNGVSRIVGAEEINGGDRKSAVWGQSVSVRVDLGGRRSIETQKNKTHARPDNTTD